MHRRYGWLLVLVAFAALGTTGLERTPLVPLDEIHEAALRAKLMTTDDVDLLLGREGNRVDDLSYRILDMLGEPDVRVRASAAYLAGIYRMPRTIEALTLMLGEVPPLGRAEKEKLPIGMTPAADALERIGTRRVSQAMVGVLTRSDAPDVREQAVRVLVKVEGKRHAMIWLEEELAKHPASSPEVSRLRAAQDDVGKRKE